MNGFSDDRERGLSEPCLRVDAIGHPLLVHVVCHLNIPASPTVLTKLICKPPGA